MLWCMEWVTVLDAALVVRTSKCQKLSWIWGKEEGEGGGGDKKRVGGRRRRNGEGEDEREEEKEDVYKSDFPGKALDQYSSFLGLEISHSREDEEGRGYLECIHIYPQPSFGNLIQPCTQLQTLNHLNSHKQGFGKH